MSIGGIVVGLVALLVAIYSMLRGEQKEFNDSRIPQPVSRWYPLAKKYAEKFNVPVEYVMGVIWKESTGNPGARGKDGEYGLMQVLPGAVSDLAWKYPKENFDGWKRIPEQNIKAGTAYLRLQYERAGTWDESLDNQRSSAFEAYNEGFKGSQSDTGADSYAETVRERAKFFT